MNWALLLIIQIAVVIVLTLLAAAVVYTLVRINIFMKLGTKVFVKYLQDDKNE